MKNCIWENKEGVTASLYKRRGRIGTDSAAVFEKSEQ